MGANLDALNTRLSGFKTSWTLVQQAHEGNPEERQQAVTLLLARYGQVVRHYLLGITRNEEKAENLFQEFSLRLWQGRFRGACPEKGKFRHYLKKCLATLVADTWDRLGAISLEIAEGREPVDHRAGPTISIADEEFTSAWRQALMAGTLLALARDERRHGHGWYTVMKARLEWPEANSQELAAKISEQGKTVSPGWFRKKLMHARGRFAELLLDELAPTLEEPTLEAIQKELIELGLWEYCREYVEAARDKSCRAGG